jgi:T4-like virus tail tube protein gp19
MAQAAIRPLNTDPLRSFKFNVIIPFTPPGDGHPSGIARLGFMSMSGLGIAIEPLTYREGGDNLTTRKMPGQADFNPITLSRGLFPTDYDNWYWMQMLFTALYAGGAGTTANGVSFNQPFTSSQTNLDFRTTMYINVLQHPLTANGIDISTSYQNSFQNQSNIVQISYKLYSAWIGSYAVSDLDAGGNAVAVEQLSLNYEGFDVNWGNGGYVANAASW